MGDLRVGEPSYARTGAENKRGRPKPPPKRSAIPSLFLEGDLQRRAERPRSGARSHLPVIGVVRARGGRGRRAQRPVGGRLSGLDTVLAVERARLRGHVGTV